MNHNLNIIFLYFYFVLAFWYYLLLFSRFFSLFLFYSNVFSHKYPITFNYMLKCLNLSGIDNDSKTQSIINKVFSKLSYFYLICY